MVRNECAPYGLLTGGGGGRAILEPGEDAGAGHPAEAGIERGLDIGEAGIEGPVGGHPGAEVILAGVGGEGRSGQHQEGEKEEAQYRAEGGGWPEIRRRGLRNRRAGFTPPSGRVWVNPDLRRAWRAGQGPARGMAP